jgi:hypothetical protein
MVRRNVRVSSDGIMLSEYFDAGFLHAWQKPSAGDHDWLEAAAVIHVRILKKTPLRR